jgi:hypothetical protein
MPFGHPHLCPSSRVEVGPFSGGADLGLARLAFCGWCANLEGNEGKGLRHVYDISHQRVTTSPAITAFVNPLSLDRSLFMESKVFTLRMIHLPQSLINLLVSLCRGVP